MAEFKPTAGLASGLLAQKGGARPAMRRQFSSLFEREKEKEKDKPRSDDLDDLGWNDMGAAGGQSSDGDAPQTEIEREVPSQRVERKILFPSVQSMAGAYVDEDEDEDDEPEARSGASYYQGGRERSFTLRMSEERHARLRQACAERQCSAQLLVTEALDHFLAVSSPERPFSGESRQRD